MQSSTADEQSLVRSVQQALNDQGYSTGAVDGVMGPHTQAALRKFQSAKGLQATGQLDPATIAALGMTQPAGSSTTGMHSHAAERVSSSATVTRSSQ